MYLYNKLFLLIFFPFFVFFYTPINPNNIDVDDTNTDNKNF